MKKETLQALQHVLSDNNSVQLNVLKSVLTENGFKHTNTAANIMLTEMQEMGMNNETALFWGTLATQL